jgi:hypothetical protein
MHKWKYHNETSHFVQYTLLKILFWKKKKEKHFSLAMYVPQREVSKGCQT